MEKMLLGDCLDLMPQLESQSVDCIIADLPYGITRAKWDSFIPLDKLWPEYRRIIKPNSPIVLFGSQPFTSVLITSNLKEFKYCWYWQKERGTGFLNAKKQPLRCIEEICVFHEKGHYYPQMEMLEKPYEHKLPSFGTAVVGKVASFDSPNPGYGEHTHSYPKVLLKFAREIRSQTHSTQKPLALMEYLVKTYTLPGQIVLDNTMGTGTTCLAAKNLGRDYIGMEIDPQYFDMACERVKPRID
jgi:site-specific DNA-methyltransferase (adenine-specific)